jgi:integrase
MESQKARGEWLDPALARITVGDWAASWLEGQVQLKPSTMIRYRVALRNQILPTWGGVPLQAVTHGEIALWIQKLCDSGLAPGTVRYAHRVLSLSLGHAVEDGRLARNPADRVRLPRVMQPALRFLDHGQVDDLAAACGDYRLLVLTLAYTGLRWGEAAALRVRNVNLAADLTRGRIKVVESASEASGTITIGTPKSHRDRSVPVPAFLVVELAGYLKGRSPEELVFTAPGGGPLRNSNFRRRVFDPATTKVGQTGVAAS